MIIISEESANEEYKIGNICCSLEDVKKKTVTANITNPKMKISMEDKIQHAFYPHNDIWVYFRHTRLVCTLRWILSLQISQ